MKKIALSIYATILALLAFAQEKGAEVNVDINKNSGGGHWYASPWVWVIGAAVFILLLVALSRGSGSRAD